MKLQDFLMTSREYYESAIYLINREAGNEYSWPILVQLIVQAWRGYF